GDWSVFRSNVSGFVAVARRRRLPSHERWTCPPSERVAFALQLRRAEATSDVCVRSQLQEGQTCKKGQVHFPTANSHLSAIVDLPENRPDPGLRRWCHSVPEFVR